MPKITTRDGTAIFYRDWGSGPPIVFSHGWPLTGAAWEARCCFSMTGVTVLSPMTGGVTAIPINRDPATMSTPGPTTWMSSSTRLIFAAQYWLGTRREVGELARYISRHGTSRVAKMVLLDSIVPVMMQRDGIAGGTPKSVIDSIRAGVAHDRSSFYKELSAPFFGANRPSSTATQGMRDLFWFQGLLGGAKAQYETTYSWELDYTKDIAKCDVPLLVIHCEDDQIVPIEPTGRRVPSVVPHAVLKVYPGGAHGIAIVDPERVNADLLAFVKGEMKG